MRDAVKKLEHLKLICDELRDQNKKIVFTTGAYDILHKGHILYLDNAKKQGDVLIVGINDDDFVRKTKGPGRPYNNQESRALVVASLIFVDFVYILDETEDVDIIRAVRPHIFVMSSSSHRSPEFRQHQISAVMEHGGQVRIFKQFYNVHSSDIVDKIGKS